jgi:hypothetical protein
MPKIKTYAQIAEKRTARRHFGREKDPSFDLSQSILVRHHITLATGQHTIPNNTTVFKTSLLPRGNSTVLRDD